MKIGIDARPLCASITGIGRYTLEVVKVLSQRSDVELVLYAPERLPDALGLSNVAIRVVAPPKIFPYFINHFWWLFFTLPKAIKRDSLGVFWSARHRLPWLNNKKTKQVLSVNDIVCYKFPDTMRKANWLVERVLLPFSIKRADHIIAISQATKDDLMDQFKLPSDKISVVHLAHSYAGNLKPISLNNFDLKEDYLFFLSTLEPRKNIERVVDAYLKLPSELRDKHQLVLAGNYGWKSETLHQKIDALQSDGQVKYLGYVDDDTAAGLLKQAMVFVYPSIYEGFGLPLTEAMHFGLPVITSTDPACKEVAGDAAYCVNPYSVDEMARGFMEVLTNTELRNSLSEKSLARSKCYSWEKTTSEHQAVFSSCVNS